MKDPAFLFYPKDWIEGTAEMSAHEKGVYIDLLCYQHQKGSIPNCIEKLSRLVRLPQEDFVNIWSIVKDKFVPIDIPNGTPNGERLVNLKLQNVMTERFDRGNKNKLIGTFAHVLKKLNLNKNDERLLKSRFNVNELIKLDSEWSTERLTEWCLNGIPFIANANANANIDNIENKGEEKKPVKPKITDEAKQVFEAFRKKYPGTKRGLDTEINDFTHKHKDWPEIIMLLETAIDYQIASRDRKKQVGQFVPEWKNLKTWLNNRCWEENMIDSPKKLSKNGDYESMTKKDWKPE